MPDTPAVTDAVPAICATLTVELAAMLGLLAGNHADQFFKTAMAIGMPVPAVVI
jgi:hypothetical protein